MIVQFDRALLEHAFEELGGRLYAHGITAEIAIYGGSALMLSYAWRAATRDVDAVFERDRASIRKIALEMAAERNWPPSWLNDGVKGWLSSADAAAASKSLFKTYPSENEPGLRVFLASPRYLLAMKCRAMRLSGADCAQDGDDILRLAAELRLTTAEQVLDVVLAYYPASLIEPKTRFGLEELFGTPDSDQDRAR